MPTGSTMARGSVWQSGQPKYNRLIRLAALLTPTYIGLPSVSWRTCADCYINFITLQFCVIFQSRQITLQIAGVWQERRDLSLLRTIHLDLAAI